MKPEYQFLAMAEDGESGRAGASGCGRPSREIYRSSAHFRSLLDGLLALKQSGILFDVVLLVEGRPIQAHRILLAASCDYFRYKLLKVSVGCYFHFECISPIVIWSAVVSYLLCSFCLLLLFLCLHAFLHHDYEQTPHILMSTLYNTSAVCIYLFTLCYVGHVGKGD